MVSFLVLNKYSFSYLSCTVFMCSFSQRESLNRPDLCSLKSLDPLLLLCLESFALSWGRGGAPRRQAAPFLPDSQKQTQEVS